MPPRTRTAAQAQDTEREASVRQLLRLFFPALVRMSQIPLALDEMRYDMCRDVFEKLLQVAARDDLLYAEVRKILPKELQSLDAHRKKILKVFAQFESNCYIIHDQAQMAQEMDRTADKLCEQMTLVDRFDRHNTKTQAKFMIGILVMVLNEVAKLGQNTHPRRTEMYRLLMHPRPNLPPRLYFGQIEAWSEEEWKDFPNDVQVLVFRFASLQETLTAPGYVTRELQKLLPKILPADPNERDVLVEKARQEARSEFVESPDEQEDSASDDGGDDDEENDEVENRGESRKEASESADDE